MKNKIKTILLGSILASGTAFAGVSTGKVKNVKLVLDSKLLIATIENHQSKPSCVTWNHNMGYPFDGSDESKALMTLLLTAEAAGNTVRVVGSGSCMSNSGAEKIRDIDVYSN